MFKPGLKCKCTFKLIIKGGQGTSGKNKTHPIYKKKGIVGRTSPLEELEKHKTAERGNTHRKHCKSIMETEADCFSFNGRKIETVFKTNALFLVFSEVIIVFLSVSVSKG